MFPHSSTTASHIIHGGSMVITSCYILSMQGYHRDEHLIMNATVGEHLSIQVRELQHQALEHTTTAVVYTWTCLWKINVVAARGPASEVVVKSISNPIAKSGARVAV